MRYLIPAALITFGALVMGVIGSMDAEDERREERVYCAMVRDGVWPDYRGTYATMCPINRHGKTRGLSSPLASAQGR